MSPEIFLFPLTEAMLYNGLCKILFILIKNRYFHSLRWPKRKNKMKNTQKKEIKSEGFRISHLNNTTFVNFKISNDFPLLDRNKEDENKTLREKKNPKDTKN